MGHTCGTLFDDFGSISGACWTSFWDPRACGFGVIFQVDFGGGPGDPGREPGLRGRGPGKVKCGFPGPGTDNQLATGLATDT